MNFLKMKELRERGWRQSRATTYRDISEGTFPKPIKIGAASYWGDSEVDRIIAAYTRGASKADLKGVVAQIHAERLG